MGSETVRSSALSSSGKLYYQFFPGETVCRECYKTLPTVFQLLVI